MWRSLFKYRTASTPSTAETSLCVGSSLNSIYAALTLTVSGGSRYTTDGRDDSQRRARFFSRYAALGITVAGSQRATCTYDGDYAPRRALYL